MDVIGRRGLARVLLMAQDAALVVHRPNGTRAVRGMGTPAASVVAVSFFAGRFAQAVAVIEREDLAILVVQVALDVIAQTDH